MCNNAFILFLFAPRERGNREQVEVVPAMCKQLGTRCAEGEQVVSETKKRDRHRIPAPKYSAEVALRGGAAIGKHSEAPDPDRLTRKSQRSQPSVASA